MEKFFPRENNTGSIGTADRAWGRGYFENLSIGGVDYTGPAADGTAGQVLATDGAGTLSFTAAGGATAINAIGDAAAAGQVDCTTNAQVLTSTKTNGDMFNIQGLGDFGDVSVLRIESKTGNPTNGTVLEVIAHDANVDPLTVTAQGGNGLIVGQDGNTSVTGDLAVTGDLTVTGTYGVDAITAATATQSLVLNGEGVGGVDIGSASSGDITLGDTVVVSDGFNVTIGEGSLIIDNDATDETALTITAAATTSGSAIEITSANTSSQAVKIVAAATTSGDVLYLGATEATLAGGGNYIHCYDAAATDFKVARYGAVTIAGNASTDVITITNGDIQITNGDIDLDQGQLMVDTTQDLAHNISRNFDGAGTSPVLTVKDDHTNTTNVALHVESDGTGAATCLKLVHDGDGPVIDIDAGVARTGDVIDILMTNMVAERALVVTGAMTSANGEGVIEVHTTGNIASGGTLLRLDADTGTPAGTQGFMMYVDDDSLAQAGAYAVEINSENNEALRITKGKLLVAEQATFTAGIDSDAGLDIDMATNADLVNITNAAADLAAGAGVTTVYGSNAAGQTNAAYLMRLAWKADGDAQDGFLLLQDNSTGAAANGDQKLKVGPEGSITMGAGTTGTGGALIYSFETLTAASEGVAASVVQVVTFIETNGDGDEDAVTLADGTIGQVKIFVTTVEAAGGDSWKVTPAHMNGGTKVTFDGVVGDGCTMIFDGTSWNVVSNNGGAIS